MSDPILIWGAGAIGGTLGAAFIRTGHEVVFVDNVPEHVTEMNEFGLRIVGPIFEDTVRAKAFLPADLIGQFETIFLCVKALHTDAAARDLLPHVAPNGVVVSAQNGLNELVIADIIGRDRTMGCFVNFGADFLEPGIVTFGGRGAVVIGELDGSTTERLVALHKLLLDFEPDAVLTSNIWGYLWGKLVYGALLFATALTNDSIADALADPAYRAVLTDLGREVGAVAKAEGIATEAFNGFDPGAFVPGASQAQIDNSFDEMVVHNRKSTKSHSGIWRDLAVRKRQTEAQDQLGPIVDAGRRNGVQTPLTARLIAMIREMETGQRTFSPDNMTVLASAGTVAVA
ncbi:2-dehydropantoate 2-reductase [Devosia sp. UYZn731]|uniref:ketopantoate reductase family protein n=1 Tax=Devosia sp. UYZn731 TaxID=3156345 RepID=UPI00339A06DD